MKKKAKGAKDDSEDEDSEDDDLDNLDDDEVSLGSMNEEFAEIEEDGGTFMDVLDDENEGIPGKPLNKLSALAEASFSLKGFLILSCIQIYTQISQKFKIFPSHLTLKFWVFNQLSSVLDFYLINIEAVYAIPLDLSCYTAF